jgi:hypothetical protein
LDEEEEFEEEEAAERVLDKEEKEMDEGDDEDDDVDGQRLARDVKIMEEAMEEEIEGAVKKTKPVRQVLFKVGFSYVVFLLFYFLPFLKKPVAIPSPFFMLGFLFF